MPAISKKATKCEAALRDFALRYPETHEDHPWGHNAFKVKGKAFLFTSGEKPQDGVFSFSVKLPVTGKTVLQLPFASPTEYGLGKSGWVTCRFGPKDDIPLEMIKEWVDESYRAIAPKRLVATLESNHEKRS